MSSKLNIQPPNLAAASLPKRSKLYCYDSKVAEGEEWRNVEDASGGAVELT